MRIYVDWSLLLIFTLVFVNLGAGLLPSRHPDWGAIPIWLTALAAAILFFVSILAHEMSHALVARRNGIGVSRITLFVFGGMAHMEGEPPSPKSEFWMAIVGPITSIAIGLAAVAGGMAIAPPEFVDRMQDEDVQRAIATLGPLASLLLWLGPINIALGVFNMVPGFPLDGGRVLRSILWWASGDLKQATLWASRGGRVVAWALMAWGVMNLMGGGLVQGMWLLLIGWFLNNAARASYQQLIIRESLHDVPVSRLMRSRLDAVEPQTSVEELVRDGLMATDQRAFPVIRPNGSLAGLVCIDDVRKVSRDAWGSTVVADIMTPADQLESLPPDALSDRALKILNERDVSQVPILLDERLVGMVRRQDVLKWLSLHLDPSEFGGSFGQ